jgi:hypothetical protein
MNDVTHKCVAIPVRLNKPSEKLSDQDREELKYYGDVPLTQEEILARETEIQVSFRQKLILFVDTYRAVAAEGLVSFQGISAHGDDKTRAAISETVQFWQELDPEDAPDTIDWQSPDGFHAISLSTLIGLGKQIGFQRQKSFSVKKAVLAAIEAGQITTIEEAKAAFDAGMLA